MDKYVFYECIFRLQHKRELSDPRDQRSQCADQRFQDADPRSQGAAPQDASASPVFTSKEIETEISLSVVGTEKLNLVNAAWSIMSDYMKYHKLERDIETLKQTYELCSIISLGPCSGCIEDQPNQAAHMHFGGCLFDNYEDPRW